MALVSIIVPAYNASRWIQETVESALGQTWGNLEIIVVDDGSTDETVAVASAISDDRVRVVTQANRGAAAARNRGLREASGEWIQFLDADDLLSPDKIRLQIEALGGEPGDRVASCSWVRFDADVNDARERPEPVWPVTDPVEWLVVSLSGGGMMQTGAWLIPRELAERAGPWGERLSLHDDGEYFTRVLLTCSEIVFVPAAKVFYRDVPHSLSRAVGRGAMTGALAVCHSRRRHLLRAADTPEVRRALATQYADFVYQFGHLAPDLQREALRCIRDLGQQPVDSVGGETFKCLVKLMGHEAALRGRGVVLSGMRRVDSVRRLWRSNGR